MSITAMATDVKRPIPILLVVRELGFGGIERDVAKLAIGINRARFTPYVATYKPFGPRYDELGAAGVHVHHLDMISLASRHAVSAALRLRRFIREHEIRLVHAFDPSSVFAVPAARAFGVKGVLSSQLGHRSLHDARTRRQLKLVDRLSDRIVVNCESLKQHLIEDHRVPSNRIALCYNGVDTREFYPGRQSRIPMIGEASVLIGAACVLRPEKGLDLLLAAFSRVRKRRNGVKLMIVGNGQELPRLQAQAAALEITRDCIFQPAVPKLAPILRSLDIFASPSRSEAFSNSVLEAMACGCAVVGSRIGGTPELTGNDERGLLFESGNINDLESKLLRLVDSEKLRQSLGETASKYAREHLSIQSNVNRACEIYEDVLSGKKAGGYRSGPVQQVN